MSLFPALKKLQTARVQKKAPQMPGRTAGIAGGRAQSGLSNKSNLGALRKFVAARGVKRRPSP